MKQVYINTLSNKMIQELKQSKFRKLNKKNKLTL